MNAREIKALTGVQTKADGIKVIYAALEKRPWSGNGRTYTVAGYDSRKDLVHFTATWEVEGGAGHSRVGMPLACAVANKDGDLSNAKVLH